MTCMLKMQEVNNNCVCVKPLNKVASIITLLLLYLSARGAKNHIIML